MCDRISENLRYLPTWTIFLAFFSGGQYIQQNIPALSDVKGIALNLIVVILFCQPIAIYLFTLISPNLHPYIQLYSIIIEQGWRLPFVVKGALLFLGVTLFVPLFLISRTICVFICAPAITVYLSLECISTFLRTAGYQLCSANNAIVDKYLRGYASFRIIFAISEEFAVPLVGITMFIGMWVNALFNFISLNMYGIIPPSAFPYFPAVSLLMAGVIQLLLPLIVSVYEDGVVLRAKWMCLLGGSQDKKYLKRKLSSIRLSAVYGGILGFYLYKCKRSTKFAFFGAIVSYTVTASLSYKANRRQVWYLN